MYNGFSSSLTFCRATIAHLFAKMCEANDVLAFVRWAALVIELAQLHLSIQLVQLRFAAVRAMIWPNWRNDWTLTGLMKICQF